MTPKKVRDGRYHMTYDPMTQTYQRARELPCGCIQYELGISSYCTRHSSGGPPQWRRSYRGGRY